MAAHRLRHGHHPARHLRARFFFASLAVLAGGGAGLGALVLRRVQTELALAASFAHSAQASTWEIVRPAVIPAMLLAVGAVAAVALLAKAAVLHAVAASSCAVAAQIRAWLAGQFPLPEQPQPKLREFRHLRWLLAEGLHHHRARTDELRRAVAAHRAAIRAHRASLERGGGVPDHVHARALHAGAHAVRAAMRAFRLPPP